MTYNIYKLLAERHVIGLLVNPGDDTPYTYDGRPFMRNQSTTMRMPKEDYAYLHNKNKPTLWEGLINHACTIKDLDHERIKEVVRMGVFEKRLPESAMGATVPNTLKKLNLMVNDKLTNAAVILFCKNESKQFMQSNIQLARFKGTTKSEFLNNKKYRANAFDLYDKAMDFLVFSLPIAARIVAGNPVRVETPAIPYTVLREALINALVHRDYSNAGASISVAVYDDRINISNVGSLPRGVELSKLSKEHPSVQRNPLIADVFYICGKIEGWGRGTLDMIKDSKLAGNPLPKYEEIGNSFSVTLPLKETMPTIVYEQKVDLNSLTNRQKEIIEALRKGPLKMPQIMKRMSVALSDRTTQLELAKLRKMGLIKSIGKTKSTMWALSID